MAYCVDLDTFSQILEMDDDDDRRYEERMVTLVFPSLPPLRLMTDIRRENKDLPTLLALGNHLEDSSVAVGMSKITEAGEKIEHYGEGMDETGTVNEPDEDVSLHNPRNS
ncbi:hypothetical protein EYZ11_006085 [Aspergillus tanneri]|uniref:Uncharacterized protein n=1 Tax=Aspergillus tanneri TaxID=1220188 RepID=A0A4S3JIV0_9EURO|nr:uncharacterized protein ATNIH1004_006110 [Aspergillus tanneri]KAA8647417.1 hypothetical protein ATNIH1004_006110 [Aspergillus tanneri]THC94448.1 hypothetical protein EYZ11_006085 [Aspergillus tanneri]